MLATMIATTPLVPPLSPGALHGLTALDAGLQAKPTMTLSFYHFGILLHRMTDDGGELEYAISPAQLAGALAIKVKFETGLLNGNTLFITNTSANCRSAQAADNRTQIGKTPA